MRRIGGAIGVVLLAAGPAAAEPPGDGYVVSEDFCAAFELHRPAPDVAYRPGVDVHGRPVVPADLDDPERLVIEDDIGIVPDIRVGSFYNIPDGQRRVLDAATIDLGAIAILDGKVYLEGQLIGSDRRHALAQACAELQAELRESGRR